MLMPAGARSSSSSRDPFFLLLLGQCLLPSPLLSSSSFAVVFSRLPSFNLTRKWWLVGEWQNGGLIDGFLCFLLYVSALLCLLVVAAGRGGDQNQRPPQEDDDDKGEWRRPKEERNLGVWGRGINQQLCPVVVVLLVDEERERRQGYLLKA
jgi:hypothetical protein